MLLIDEGIAMDYDEQKIFINYANGSIVTITLNDDNQHKLEEIKRFHDIESGHASKGIVINNKFHMIGGNGKFVALFGDDLLIHYTKYKSILIAKVIIILSIFLHLI